MFLTILTHLQTNNRNIHVNKLVCKCGFWEKLWRLVNESIMKGKRYNNELTSAKVMGSAGNHLYLSELTAILNRERCLNYADYAVAC